MTEDKADCAWCQDYGDGMDPEPCPRHSEPVEPPKPRWLPGEWPEMRDN